MGDIEGHCGNRERGRNIEELIILQTKVIVVGWGFRFKVWKGGGGLNRYPGFLITPCYTPEINKVEEETKNK